MYNKDKLYVQFKEEGDNGECILLVSHDNRQWSGGSIMTLDNLVELYKELGKHLDKKSSNIVSKKYYLEDMVQSELTFLNDQKERTIRVMDDAKYEHNKVEHAMRLKETLIKIETLSQLMADFIAKQE